MHCLYCDRPLALLKRLTGDGEFCSKEHRKIYQKEHNQLALARLLDAQPANKAKRQSSSRGSVAAPVVKPVAPPPVEKSDEHQPEKAGFISDFLREASAVSNAHVSAGPLFQAGCPVLEEPHGADDRALPKTAAFLPESPAPFFAGEVKFPGELSAEPIAGSPRLGERQGSASVAIRLQPGGAGIVSGLAFQPVSSATKARQSDPRFSSLVPAKLVTSVAASGAHPRLLPAAQRGDSPSGAPLFPAGVRSLPMEPRWRPLAAAVPTKPLGKLIMVLGSFLRRPVRMASHDSLPEIFEIPFRPIPFPRSAPRMGVLEERPYLIERIGITPP